MSQTDEHMGMECRTQNVECSRKLTHHTHELCIFKIIDVYAMRIIISFYEIVRVRLAHVDLGGVVALVPARVFFCAKLVRSIYAHRKRKNINIPWQQQIKQPLDNDDGDDVDDDFACAMCVRTRMNVTHLLLVSFIFTPVIW